MSLHKFRAQNRKGKKKRDDNERRGLPTLIQVGMKNRQDYMEIYPDTNLEEVKKVGGCREQDSVYENEIEANKETIQGHLQIRWTWILIQNLDLVKQIRV